MKKLTIILITILSFTQLNAQDVVLEETISDTTGDAAENLLGKSFGGSISVGFPFGDAGGPNGKVESFTSPLFSFSMNFKNRITNVFGFTAALKYSNEEYRIDQNAIDKHKVIFNNFGLAAGVRLYGGTGKLKKNFLELGGYGDFMTGSRVESENDVLMPIDPTISAQHIFIQRNLNITNDLLYGVHGKIAFGTIALYGKYRLADYFSSIYDEFPQFSAGVEFGF